MHLESWRWVLFRCSSKVGAILYELLLGRTTLVAPWGTFVAMMVHDAKCYTKRTPLLLAKRRLAIQCGNRTSTLCISYRIIQHIVVLSMTILNFPVRILLLWGFCHHYGTCRQDTLQRIQPFATFSRKLSGPPNGLRHYLEDSPNWNGGSIDAIDVNHGQSKWSTDNWIISNDNRLSIMTSNDWIMKMAATPMEDSAARPISKRLPCPSRACSFQPPVFSSGHLRDGNNGRLVVQWVQGSWMQVVYNNRYVIYVMYILCIYIYICYIYIYIK